MEQTMPQSRYNSDVSDREWGILKVLLPADNPTGRPRQYSLRRIINGIFYVTRTGCQWRMLPNDFPPWWTVYFYFRAWKLAGLWEDLNALLRRQIRQADGREAEPSAAIIDSQSVKTTEAGGVRGYDAGKKINGRKRHILVDTLGLLLTTVVHSAAIQDRDGAKLLLEKIIGHSTRLALIWADGGYAGQLIEWVNTHVGVKLEIVKRSDDVKGFKVLPRRWVVERTFGWLCRNRRLCKDYERTASSSEAFIYTSMVRLMVRRLALA
jgi:putative transposase